MIKPNEIRIGNYVNAEVGLPSLQIHKVLSRDFNYIYDGTVTVYGIQLTEDILLKCGIELKFEEFEDGHRMSYWVKGAFNLEIGVDGKICFEVYSHYIEVKYLHQLQNLYFALTGEELNINF